MLSHFPEWPGAILTALLLKCKLITVCPDLGFPFLRAQPHGGQVNNSN